MRPRLKLPVVIASLVAALAGPATGGAPAAMAITGGAPDGSGHPYVAMVLGPGATAPGCTGALVRTDGGAQVVLTDAHCLFRGGRHDGTGVRFTFASTWSASAQLHWGRFYVDPGYHPRLSTMHDIAVIVPYRTQSPAPAHLAAVGKLGTWTGSTVTVVGTGSPYRGQRRVATERITRHDAYWLYLVPGNGNTCSGDSGGPDLIPGTATVLALTDRGTCSWDQDTRTDTAAVHQLVGAAATWPRTAPRLSIALSASSVPVGSSVTLRGRTSALYSGETLYRQGYYGGAWHAWATTSVRWDGSYSFTISPTVRTTDHYRLWLPANGAHPAGASATVALTVH
ncbi:MAG: trypsin-like serine protease [Frankiaceae bacterium]